MATGLIGVTWGAQASRDERYKLIAGLESESPEVRAKASAEVLARQQPGDIAEVMRIVEKYLKSDDRQGTVKDNMLLLGKLHALEAIPLLVQNLTFEAFYKNTKRPQPPADLFPAVQALIDIGRPSVRPVLARLAAEDGEKLGIAGATVLRRILGLRDARALLSDEIAAAKEERSQARLRIVLSLIEKVS
ncbi:MAG TPA: hypothetical protein VME43_20185 [Bryobacteraceae bacterium]|nr:hypothetical protein [Bryobacteraceae bacterium]